MEEVKQARAALRRCWGSIQGQLDHRHVPVGILVDAADWLVEAASSAKRGEHEDAVKAAAAAMKLVACWVAGDVIGAGY